MPQDFDARGQNAPPPVPGNRRTALAILLIAATAPGTTWAQSIACDQALREPKERVLALSPQSRAFDAAVAAVFDGTIDAKTRKPIDREKFCAAITTATELAKAFSANIQTTIRFWRAKTHGVCTGRALELSETGPVILESEDQRVRDKAKVLKLLGEGHDC